MIARPTSFPPSAPGGPPLSGSTPLTLPLASGYNPNAGAGSKKSRKPLILVGLLVVLVAAVAVFLVTKGGDKVEAAQPTRKELAAALLPIREIRDAFGTEWNADEPEEGEPFCEQFALEEATRERSSLFFATETADDGTSSTKIFTQAIASYASEDGAQRAFDQDKEITENCQTQESDLFGVAVTYRFTDSSRAVSKLGDDVVSIQYVADATDGSQPAVASGFIVVRKTGSLLMSTSYELTYREISDDEFDSFLDLTMAAYERADESL